MDDLLYQEIDAIEEAWEGCQKCPLHESRSTIVHWRGNPDAELMVIGEAPGADEDREGVPFVGKAGRKMDELLRAAGMLNDHVFIVNMVGCRPPGNRVPEQEEVKACMPRLEQLIKVNKPKAMLLLGGTAARRLAKITSITQWRGQEVEVELLMSNGDIASWPAIPTFHPSYLLRSGSDRAMTKQMISDFSKAMALAYE